MASAPQSSLRAPQVQPADLPPYFVWYQRDLRSVQELQRSYANNRGSDAYRAATLYVDTVADILKIVGPMIEDCVNARFAGSCVGVAKQAQDYVHLHGKKHPDYAGAQMYFQRACGLGDKGSCKKAQDAGKKASQSQ
jgi:hypothetical protein